MRGRNKRCSNNDKLIDNNYASESNIIIVLNLLVSQFGATSVCVYWIRCNSFVNTIRFMPLQLQPINFFTGNGYVKRMRLLSDHRLKWVSEHIATINALNILFWFSRKRIMPILSLYHILLQITINLQIYRSQCTNANQLQTIITNTRQIQCQTTHVVNEF